jgi:glycosyltransferase involved in cell wall biosynthesis
MPLTISLVAPIYGVEKYIGKFAESVLGQSYPHIQFVFVNDGTKDSSIEILNSVIDNGYSQLRDRIIIVNKQNAGLPAARKTGMQYVTGDYVWHVDSDDWLEIDAVKKIAAFAESHDFPDLIYFDFYKEYPDRSKAKRERNYSAADRQEYIRSMYNHKSYGCVWNKCVKRSVYLDNQVFFPEYSYAEDTYLMSQITGYSNSIEHLHDYLYHYRKDNPTAITKGNRKRRCREYALNFIDLYLKFNDFQENKNPVASIFNDMLIQAGWYSLRYNLGLFEIYPWLSGAIRELSVRSGTDVWIPAQIITKIFSFLYR